MISWSNNSTPVTHFAAGWLGFSALANAWSLVNAFLSVVSALVSVTANQIAFFRPTTPACQPPPEQTNVSVTIVEHQLKIISNLRNRSVSCTHRGCLRSNQIYICCGFPGWQTSNLWKSIFLRAICWTATNKTPKTVSENQFAKQERFTLHTLWVCQRSKSHQ